MGELVTIDLTDSPDPTPQRAAKRSRPSDHEGGSTSGASGGSSTSTSGGEGERISSIVAALAELVPDASLSRLSKLARAQPSGVSFEAAVGSALSHWYGEQPAGGGGGGGGVGAAGEREGDDEASLAIAQKMQRDEWGVARGDGNADMVQVSADSALAASMQDEILREMDGDIARQLQTDLDHQLAAQVSMQQQQGGAMRLPTRVHFSAAQCESDAGSKPEYTSRETTGTSSVDLLERLAGLIDAEKHSVKTKLSYICRRVPFYGSVQGGPPREWGGDDDDGGVEPVATSQNEGDAGWGCGYRNIQMLCGHLLSRRAPGCETSPYAACLFGGAGHVVTVKGVQAFIETAWHNGYDPQGAEQLGYALAGTEKWIGTTEALSVLRSMGVRAKYVQFKARSTKPLKHMRIWEWARDYFALGCEKAPEGFLSYWSPVRATSRPPLYLQFQGHSFTIIGVIQTERAHQLVILDPGARPSDVEAAVTSGKRWQPYTKRGIHTFRRAEYQILYVEPDGLLPMPEQSLGQASGDGGARGSILPHPLGLEAVMEEAERRSMMDPEFETEYTDGAVTAQR